MRPRVLALLLALLLLAAPATTAPQFTPSVPTYNVFVASIAAANKDHLTVFNAAGSGVLLRVHRVAVGTVNTAAVVGAMIYFNVDKVTTAGTTCTAVTIRPYDSGNAALPAQVTSTANCTTDPTSAWTWSSCSISTEETLTQPGGQTQVCYESQRAPDANPQPIILREGEGLGLKQTALAGAGTVGLWITFGR